MYAFGGLAISATVFYNMICAVALIPFALWAVERCRNPLVLGHCAIAPPSPDVPADSGATAPVAMPEGIPGSPFIEPAKGPPASPRPDLAWRDAYLQAST